MSEYINEDGSIDEDAAAGHWLLCDLCDAPCLDDEVELMEDPGGGECYHCPHCGGLSYV